MDADKIVDSGIPGLTSVLRAVCCHCEGRCKHCSSRLRGVVKATIHPADAVIAFDHWAYIEGPSFKSPDLELEVPLFAREWVDRSKVVFELMDGSMHEFEYSPMLTEKESKVDEGMAAVLSRSEVLNVEDYMNQCLEESGYTEFEDLGDDDQYYEGEEPVYG